MLKKVTPVIVIVLPFLVLVLYRTSGNDRFRPGTERSIELSSMKSNIINAGNISSLPGEKLIINLGSVKEIPRNIVPEQVSIPAGSVLDKENLKLFKTGNRKVLLWSDDPAVAARTWMLLSRMGYKDVFILSDEGNDELFKYEFRPDSTSAAGILNN